MFTTVGDQARTHALQSHATRLKETLSVLSNELATGEVGDLAQRLNGNTRFLGAVEARLANLRQYQDNLAELSARQAALQTSLGQMQDLTQGLASQLASGLSGQNASGESAASISARSGFEDAITRLNSSFAGQFLFSGTKSDTTPVLSADAILDMLRPKLVGLGDAASVVQAVTDWFDAPPGGGGFVDAAYAGSIGAEVVVPVGAGTSVRTTITAMSEPIRKALAGLAVGALTQGEALPNLSAMRGELLQQSGVLLLQNDTGMTGLRAQLGLDEQRVARAKSENEAQESQLNILRNGMREADPYATSSALTQIETQLQTLFEVQARLSNLHLASFLR